MSVLTLKNLQIEPLDSFSADIAPGKTIGLMGISGSGKSRLLHAIADLLPHAGTVLLDNTPCEQMAPARWRQQVMLVPSRIEWWHDKAQEHFVTVPSSAQLAAFHLESDILQQPITSLSTGQKQRLGILRALTRSPTVLLLDEPTANLDQDNALRVEKAIVDWVKENTRAVIWCSHDEQQISRIANKIWHVDDHHISEQCL